MLVKGTGLAHSIELLQGNPLCGLWPSVFSLLLSKGITIQLETSRLGAGAVFWRAPKQSFCICLAAFISYPIDTISRVMIMEGVAGNPLSLVACVQQIFASGGIMGFYSGIRMKLIYIAVQTNLIIIVHELFTYMRRRAAHNRG